jgi:hypothetical protein
MKPASLVNNGASISHYTVDFAPLVIGPGQSMLLYRWVTANSQTPAFDVEIGFIEK